MRQRTLLVVAGWLVGAAATAAVATAAVNASGAGLLGPSGHTLSQAEVRRQLAASGPSSSPTAAPVAGVPGAGAAIPGATGTGSPTSPSGGDHGADQGGDRGGQSPAPSSPTGGARLLSTAGGTILARCSGGQVTLVSWSPAQAYRADDVERGPASSARVEFKAGRSELRVTVTCAGDQPSAAVADDH